MKGGGKLHREMFPYSNQSKVYNVHEAVSLEVSVCVCVCAQNKAFRPQAVAPSLLLYITHRPLLSCLLPGSKTHL